MRYIVKELKDDGSTSEVHVQAADMVSAVQVSVIMWCIRAERIISVELDTPDLLTLVQEVVAKLPGD